MLSRNATAAIQKPIEWCLRDRGRPASRDQPMAGGLVLFADSSVHPDIVFRDFGEMMRLVAGVTCKPPAP